MKTIDVLQILRFFAALFVVIYHIDPRFGPEPDFEGIFDFVQNGGAGVDIFFVISGFIITLTVIRKPTFDARSFALNRFFRIYPTYWVFLTIAILLGFASYVMTGSSGTYELISPSSLLASYFLLPIPVQIYPVAWTLTLEIAFYFIFCVAFRFGGLRGVILAVLTWYILARTFGPVATNTDGKFVWFFHSVVLEFSYGVLIAWAWQKRWIQYPKIAFVVGCFAYLAVVMALFDVKAYGREFTAGLPAALLIYGAVGIKFEAPKLAVLAGDSSYILYLIHPIIITAAKIAALKLFGINIFAHNGAAVAIVLASVIVSMLLTRYVEVPYIGWYKRLISTAQKSSVARN